VGYFVAEDSRKKPKGLKHVHNQNNRLDIYNLHTNQMNQTKLIQLRDLLKNRSNQFLYNHIKQCALTYYNKPPKDVQVSTVVLLMHWQHSFVLAGTSYGKSCIAEMYYNLFPKSCKAVVLVLNLLDSLGDNQV
jgi:hypothetical protein